MDSLPDNVKIIIGLIVGVLWIVGKISESRKKQREEQQWSPPDDESYEYEDTDEPAEQSHRRLVPPPLPRAVAPPVLPSQDREYSRQQVMQERLAALKKERAAVAKASKKSAKATAQPMVSPSSLKARLRNKQELRRAMVMREILDPPVGLR